MARFAVEYYSKRYKRKGKKMEFVRVHHANITRAYRDAYYITLLAKDLIKEDDEEEKAYQTKVDHWEFVSGGESIYVEIFRPKANPSSQAII
ncbi:hypothetical protein NC651_029522 [Populus alba x Populus x berolinensis]|nr:hypothetical protein NC651_029522 [Populus alba x Populus x berolinensis]